MLDELRELYQEVILDHGKRPRNFRHPEDANREAHGNNPLCGDRLTVFLKVDDKGVIQDAAFEGRGCAISTVSPTSSASMAREPPRPAGSSLTPTVISAASSLHATRE